MAKNPEEEKKPGREIIHREKERKGNHHTQIIVPAIAFISANTHAQKKTPKTNSQQADIIFLVLKVAEKTKGKHRQVSTEGRQREAIGENHHQHCKHLRSPEAGTLVSSFTFASSFQIELLQEHCAKVI